MPRVEFGADGIRGIVGEWPFIPSTMVSIGQALGHYVCERSESERPTVVIGRDTRPSGANLLHCLTAGLTGQCVDVIDLGVMTTPGVAFLTRRLGTNLGVIVSASHSPFEYNGIKLVQQNGLRLQREEEIEIEALIDSLSNKTVELDASPGQEIDGQNLIELYIQDHVARCQAESLADLKVVLDCADGAASRVAPEAFRRLGAEVVAINTAMEAKSINYRCGSEYVREHPQDLVEIMRRHNAAYGFAFDGDGDRLAVVDAEGRVYDGHDLLFVLATYFHAQGLLRGNAAVTNHLANRGLEDALRCAGIQTVYTGKGDKNLEAAMWGGDYLLGSEPGGNLIINDGHHTAADAVYAAIVLGEALVQNQGVSLKEMVAPLQKRPQRTISVRLPTMPTLEQRARFREEVQCRQAALGRDSRILFWDSSTEPGVFRVMVEGGPENALEKVSQTAEALGQLMKQIVPSTD
jgi:phosphoglucosamine mutase